MQDDPTQILSELKKLAKQFLLTKGYSPAQTVVEEEVLPAIDKSQQVHGGGGDQGPSRASNVRVQSRRRSHAPTKSDGGMRKARTRALSDIRAKAKSKG